MINKNIKNIIKLQEEIIKITKAEEGKYIKQLIDKVISNYKLFVQNWNSITKASREKKISTLLINPLIRKKGYIYNNRLIFSYPVKNSNIL